MFYTVKITSQGQISLPAKIRREFGFSKTNQALISVQDNKVTIEPVKDLLDLKGSIKTNKKPLTNEETHELFAQSVVEDYIKKLR